MQPLKIGRVKGTDKQVWLDTRVTVKYKNGTQDIKDFDSEREANNFVMDLLC